MCAYTTGEVAKECGVTVRTVQYYDARGILCPHTLSEGGRRLYSQEDVQKMKIICFLRELGLSLNDIGQLLEEENPDSVIALLLERQSQILSAEIAQRQEKLKKLDALNRGLKQAKHFSVQSIGDIASAMDHSKKLKRMRWLMVLTGLPVSALQWFSIYLWAAKGIWWPFVVWVAVVAVYIAIVPRLYYRKVAFLCPQCHQQFRPGFKTFFFAGHTPSARRLTCPHCGHKGFCVEIWNPLDP